MEVQTVMISLEQFYKQHLNSNLDLGNKKKKNDPFFVFFFFFFKNFFYQQFSPSPIGIQALDFAASSAIF